MSHDRILKSIVNVSQKKPTPQGNNFLRQCVLHMVKNFNVYNHRKMLADSSVAVHTDSFQECKIPLWFSIIQLAQSIELRRIYWESPEREKQTFST